MSAESRALMSEAMRTSSRSSKRSSVTSLAPEKRSVTRRNRLWSNISVSGDRFRCFGI